MPLLLCSAIYIYIYFTFRLTALTHTKSYKIQKIVNFTHFEQKTTHINWCKIVHKYINATVTVHICMITVICVFNIFW